MSVPDETKLAHDHLSIEFGRWFKASASGRFAIVAVIIVLAAGLLLRLTGWA